MSTQSPCVPRGSAILARSVAAATALCVIAFARAASADPSSTTPAQGYDSGEIQHPRALALAGAQTALGTSTNAIFNNPANLPFARVYHFEGIAALSPEARRQSYGGAIADSSTSRVAGGFGGTWSQMDPDGIKRTWTDLRLAIAYPLADRVAVGLTGRYLRLSQSIAAGPLGASYVSDGTNGQPIVNTFTFDAGLAVAPIDGLKVGVLGRNLTVPNNGVVPTQGVFGIGYSKSVVAVELDAMVDFTTYNAARGRYMGGVEVFVADRFPIRAGYRYDDGLKTHAVTGGVGFVERKYSIELGVRRDVVADHPSTMVGAGFRFFYDQAGSGEEIEPGSQ